MEIVKPQSPHVFDETCPCKTCSDFDDSRWRSYVRDPKYTISNEQVIPVAVYELAKLNRRDAKFQADARRNAMSMGSSWECPSYNKVFKTGPGEEPVCDHVTSQAQALARRVGLVIDAAMSYMTESDALEFEELINSVSFANKVNGAR